jgi:two-component system, NtrC family, sensor histidine kinase HydH
LLPQAHSFGTKVAFQTTMTRKIFHSRFLTGVPPWIFLGAVAILLPIFTFMTFENINRQKQQGLRLLAEKGAALIRSFEAGTRTGMMGMGWSGNQLQRLLYETAQQPDIDYLLVTGKDGRILAHGDPKYVGQRHGRGLNLLSVSASDQLGWRLMQTSNGRKIFEIYRRFEPTGGMGGGMGEMRGGPMMLFERFKRHLGELEATAQMPLIIFVGLDMRTVEEAHTTDRRHTLIMGVVLLLIGFAGIVFLFMAQSYRSTQKSLVRIKAFSDNLVANMPIGILAIDPDGKVVSINPTASAILDLDPKTTMGLEAAPCLPAALKAANERLTTDGHIIGHEIDCTLNNGREVPLEISASLVKDDAGTFLGQVLLFKDLSEVRALKQEIARNQRLAAVGRLAAGVAHEIRNPLSSIKGFATYFKERYQDVSEDQRIANIMIQEVDRLNRVVGQLLEFSRPIQLNKKPTALDGLVQDTLKMVERQAAEAGIQIKTVLAPQKKTVSLDPDKINQVLLNLFLNALEAMDADGTLTVTLNDETESQQASVEISDTGKGISEADQAHIFDPYFTTKASGTGLGLAIVHNILDTHGGDIKITSRIGQGTTVILVLPFDENR